MEEKQIPKTIEIPTDPSKLDSFFQKYEELKREAKEKIIRPGISNQELQRAGLLHSANSLLELDPNLGTPLTKSGFSALTHSFDSEFYQFPDTIYQSIMHRPQCPQPPAKVEDEEDEILKEIQKLSANYENVIQNYRIEDTLSKMRQGWLEKIAQKSEDTEINDLYVEYTDNKKRGQVKEKIEFVKMRAELLQNSKKNTSGNFQDFKSIFKTKEKSKNQFEIDIQIPEEEISPQITTLQNFMVSNIRKDRACIVCNIKNAFDGNEIVLCDGCNGGFHECCYGLRSSKLGDKWYCELCSDYGEIGKSIKCILCPNTGGCLKDISVKSIEKNSDKFETLNTFLDFQFYPKKHKKLRKVMKEYSQTRPVYDVYNEQYSCSKTVDSFNPKVHINCLVNLIEIEIEEKNGLSKPRKSRKKNSENLENERKAKAMKYLKIKKEYIDDADFTFDNKEKVQEDDEEKTQISGNQEKNKEICELCKVDMGVLRKCSYPECSYAFHAECGRLVDLKVKPLKPKDKPQRSIQTKNTKILRSLKEIFVDFNPEPKICKKNINNFLLARVFCPDHSHEFLKAKLQKIEEERVQECYEYISTKNYTKQQKRIKRKKYALKKNLAGISPIKKNGRKNRQLLPEKGPFIEPFSGQYIELGDDNDNLISQIDNNEQDKSEASRETHLSRKKMTEKQRKELVCESIDTFVLDDSRSIVTGGIESREETNEMIQPDLQVKKGLEEEISEKSQNLEKAKNLKTAQKDQEERIITFSFEKFNVKVSLPTNNSPRVLLFAFKTYWRFSNLNRLNIMHIYKYRNKKVSQFDESSEDFVEDVTYEEAYNIALQVASLLGTTLRVVLNVYKKYRRLNGFPL